MGGTKSRVDLAKKFTDRSISAWGNFAKNQVRELYQDLPILTHDRTIAAASACAATCGGAVPLTNA